ncbi:MAG: tRNA(His) guanylyltransferase Thg1 family protein [Candidatus Njordarchaeales archaeon]
MDTKFLLVRCDGRNFRKLAKQLRLERFDKRFHEALVIAAEKLMKTSGFDIRLSHIVSDEVSFLFHDIPFNGRVEKIDSVTSSLLASLLTIELANRFKFQEGVAFDARVIKILNIEEIAKYIYWRQSDAYRNFLNTWAYEALRRKGFSPRRIAKMLEGMKSDKLRELIEDTFGPLENFPDWQKYGTIIYVDWVRRKALNKRTGVETFVERRKYRKKTMKHYDEILDCIRVALRTRHTT